MGEPAEGRLPGHGIRFAPRFDVNRAAGPCRHLDGCPSCEAVVRGLEHVSDALLAALRLSRAAPPDGQAL